MLSEDESDKQLLHATSSGASSATSASRLCADVVKLAGSIDRVLQDEARHRRTVGEEARRGSACAPQAIHGNRSQIQRERALGDFAARQRRRPHRDRRRRRVASTSTTSRASCTSTFRTTRRTTCTAPGARLVRCEPGDRHLRRARAREDGEPPAEGPRPARADRAPTRAQLASIIPSGDAPRRRTPRSSSRGTGPSTGRPHPRPDTHARPQPAGRPSAARSSGSTPVGASASSSAPATTTSSCTRTRSRRARTAGSPRASRCATSSARAGAAPRPATWSSSPPDTESAPAARVTVARHPGRGGRSAGGTAIPGRNATDRRSAASVS